MLLLKILCCLCLFANYFTGEIFCQDLEIEEDENTTNGHIDAPTPMVAVSGARKALPCDISSPIEDDEVSLVLWYKDEVTNPIYSLDARKGTLGQARHATNEDLKGRAQFSFSGNPAVLELSKVLEEDQGLYSCRVDFKKARTRHSEIILSVVVPPNPPIIKDFNGEVLSGVIGPYNEGDSLHLICQTEGGKPAPKLIWWKRRKLLDQTYEDIAPGVIRNELTIAKLQRKDLMATISCKATNNALTSPAEASVTIDMNFRPLSVKIKDKGRPLSANKTVQFECQVTGSRPPAVVSWRKGSTKLLSSQNKVLAQGNVTTSLHTLTLTSEDNGKFLYCQGDNPVVPGSSIEDGWKLEVHYVPELSLRFGSKLASMSIVEGDDVYFECNIRATPWVFGAGWTLNGKELKAELSSGILVSNQSLVLQKVQRVSRGRYSCVAQNTEGKGESNTVYLRVQYSPVCKPGQVWTHGAILHYPVQISCEVEADPDDVVFWWEFNSTSSGGTQQYQPTYTSGTKSTLNYVPQSESDFGNLLCWARNPIGPQRAPCTFSVVPAEAPSPVHNCTSSDERQHSFRITCSEGKDGGLNQYFYIEVRDHLNNFVLQNVSANTADFVAYGLKPGVTYFVSVFASNVKGRSPPTVFQAMTASKPESQTSKGDEWPTEYTGIFLVVSGIGGGLSLIVALVVVVTIKAKAAKRRRTNDKDKNSAMENEKKSVQSSEKSGDTWSNGSDREDEKVWENKPDVVVFSEMGNPGEAEAIAFSSFSLWDSLGATPSVMNESGESYPSSHQIKRKSQIPGDPSWSSWVPESFPTTKDYGIPMQSTTQQQIPSTEPPEGTVTQIIQIKASVQTDV